MNKSDSIYLFIWKERKLKLREMQNPEILFILHVAVVCSESMIRISVCENVSTQTPEHWKRLIWELCIYLYLDFSCLIKVNCHACMMACICIDTYGGSLGSNKTRQLCREDSASAWSGGQTLYHCLHIFLCLTAMKQLYI